MEAVVTKGSPPVRDTYPGHLSFPLQVLNEFFHNVCELDLVFNFYKVSVGGVSSAKGGSD